MTANPSVDWFSIVMHLTRIKWVLWHGSSHQAEMANDSPADVQRAAA